MEREESTGNDARPCCGTTYTEIRKPAYRVLPVVVVEFSAPGVRVPMI